MSRGELRPGIKEECRGSPASEGVGKKEGRLEMNELVEIKEQGEVEEVTK